MEKYRHSIPLSSQKLDKPAATSSSNRCFQESKTRPSQYFSIMDDTVSTNRSSTKRPSSTSPSLQIAAPKRRVVLGELTNSPIQNSDRKKPMRKNNMMKKEMEVQETEIVASSVDQTKSECSSSIYQHLHSLEMEANKWPSPSYMGRVQNDISPNMREILVDWLVEVAEEYQLATDTLYLTVSYLDRKYEEICHSRVEDFCYVTDNTYMVEEMLEMERDVVKFLNSDTGPPTTKNFLRLFTRAALENNKSAGMFEFLSCFLLELSLLAYSCVQFLPSVVAASAIFLSRFTIQPNVHPWLNRKSSSLQAIREKYMRPKNKSVAKLSSLSEIPATYFEAIYP